jgi:hypothetical protein
MKKFSVSTLPLIGSILTSIAGAVITIVLGGHEAIRGTVQLAVFPILLIFLAWLRIAGVRIPRVLVGVSAIGVLCGAIVRYADVGLKEGAYGVARFESDALENRTRIFRDNVRRFVGEESLSRSHVRLLGAKVSSESDARAVLRERPQLLGVIWGSERWLTISSRLAPPISMRQMPDTSYARRRLQELGVADLWLIGRAPRIGLSKGLDAATFEFVGRFVRASSMSQNVSRGAFLSSDLEHLLQRAASIQASWSASGHLAAPKLMLGTAYLTQAISGPTLEWGDFRCAEASYRSARIIVKGGDPALKAAVYNNEAVIRILLAPDSNNPKRLLKEARVRFKQAYLTIKDSHLATLEPAYWDPIKANMKALGMEIPALKKSRRK